MKAQKASQPDFPLLLLTVEASNASMSLPFPV